MVSITILILNHQGMINTLVQTVARLESKEYYFLKKKYMPKSNSTALDTVEISYKPDKRHRIIWCETKLN